VARATQTKRQRRSTDASPDFISGIITSEKHHGWNRVMMPPLTHFKRFDVRDLIRHGIEPFPEIHQRVGKLKPDEGLIVVAPFLHSPLVERLASEGFASKVERGAGADWMVYFWREAD
jgi:hypothetical protein